jgi:hypothetical protein
MTDRFLALIVASILVLVTACAVATTPCRPGMLVDSAATVALRTSRVHVKTSWQPARGERHEDLHHPFRIEPVALQRQR